MLKKQRKSKTMLPWEYLYMEKGQFFQWSYNYKGNRLNKDIKNKNLKKDLMNLIKTNHQINMTSDHSISSNISFKSYLNAKGRVSTCF